MAKGHVNRDVGLQQPAKKFGAFLGVYTPSVLTILGLVMYLRFGWVVGNLGLPITIFVVLLASSITFITGLSASAVATNMRVGVGGEYYIISRSLGLELGGAIGIPLFLCRTLSITFYSFGFAESIITIWPASWGTATPATVQLVAAVVIVVITAVSGKSAELALKMQIPIMAAVGLSIIALIIGVVSGGMRAPEIVATFRTVRFCGIFSSRDRIYRRHRYERRFKRSAKGHTARYHCRSADRHFYLPSYSCFAGSLGTSVCR